MSQSARLTYDDLAAFPDDGLRRELIDGELIVSPSPVTRHQRLVGRIFGELWTNLRDRPDLGEAFVAPFDVLFSQTDVVEPDVLFIAGDQTVLTEKNVQGAPALVIEVLSQNTRLDRVRKRELYAKFGVPEYWIVDPDSDRVEIYRHTGNGYARPEILEKGDMLSYARIPGLNIDLSSLLAE